MNLSTGLEGSSPFEEAKINEWIAWSQSNQSCFMYCVHCIFGNPNTKFDAKTFKENHKATKDLAKTLDKELKGKKWLVGKSFSLADLIVGARWARVMQLMFSPAERKSLPNLTKWVEAFAAHSAVKKRFGAIKLCKVALLPEGVEEEADDDLDLFADDGDDAGSAKKAAAAAKEKAQAGKKPKKVVIA
jgi:hypothetical protein